MKMPSLKGFIPIKHVLFIGFLPSFLKILLYKLLGYKIGKGVSIGIGSVVVGNDVIIGDHTHIGFMTIIRGRKITLGRHVSIRHMSVINTPHIEIGDGSVITELVLIGSQRETPHSKFILGKNAIVAYLSFIDTHRSVTIGDDSGIGGHCIIVPHGAWLSQFEGYPRQFQPITIGKGVWLAWRGFVMPGVTIGDGSVIGANSLVTKDIPPNSFAAGSPAKVIKSAPDFPDVLSEKEKKVILREAVDDLIEHFNYHGLVARQNNNKIEVLISIKRLFWKRPRILRIYVAYDEKDLSVLRSDSSSAFDLVLSLPPIDSSLRSHLNERDIMWLEIARKERSKRSNTPFCEEVAKFVGSRGVRFTYLYDDDS